VRVHHKRHRKKVVHGRAGHNECCGDDAQETQAENTFNCPQRNVVTSRHFSARWDDGHDIVFGKQSSGRVMFEETLVQLTLGPDVARSDSP
jgi:hypothetical protein